MFAGVSISIAFHFFRLGSTLGPFCCRCHKAGAGGGRHYDIQWLLITCVVWVLSFTFLNVSSFLLSFARTHVWRTSETNPLGNCLKGGRFRVIWTGKGPQQKQDGGCIDACFFVVYLLSINKIQNSLRWRKHPSIRYNKNVSLNKEKELSPKKRKRGIN